MENIGVTEDDLVGDFKAVRQIWRVLRPGGALLLTVPYGQPEVTSRLGRVNDKIRLKKLFSDWYCKDEKYFVLEKGYWEEISESVASGGKEKARSKSS